MLLRRRDRLLAAISCVALQCSAFRDRLYTAIPCSALLLALWPLWLKLVQVLFSPTSPATLNRSLAHANQKSNHLDTFVMKPSGGRLVPTYLSVGMEHCT